MRISLWWFSFSFSNISLYWNKYRILAHFAFLKQPGFETITGIHINVNFQVFTHFTKQDFLIRWNINKIENKNILFFCTQKNITPLRNQNINSDCSCNLDLTRNTETKSTLVSYLTKKRWKLSKYNSTVNLGFIR